MIWHYLLRRKIAEYTNRSNTLYNSQSSYFVEFSWKTGLLILAFKCDIYGRVFSRPCSTLTSEANYSINFTQSGLFVLTFRSCSKTSWWVGYFIHFKCTRVFFYLMFLMISYYGQECQTFTIEQNWRSQNFNFLGKKIWRNALALKSKKVQGIFGETFILGLSSSFISVGLAPSSFVHKRESQISFKLLCSRDKLLLSEFRGKRGWFQGHAERFPKYLG